MIITQKLSLLKIYPCRGCIVSVKTPEVVWVLDLSHIRHFHTCINYNYIMQAFLADIGKRHIQRKMPFVFTSVHFSLCLSMPPLPCIICLHVLSAPPCTRKVSTCIIHLEVTIFAHHPLKSTNQHGVMKSEPRHTTLNLFCSCNKHLQRSLFDWKKKKTDNACLKMTKLLTHAEQWNQKYSGKRDSGFLLHLYVSFATSLIFCFYSKQWQIIKIQKKPTFFINTIFHWFCSAA